MLKEAQRIWLLGLSLLFVISFTCGTVYLIAQQSLRLGANAEPARLATETAIKLEAGARPNDAVLAAKVDITKSLEPFVMVFDKNENLVATSGMMGSNQPDYPKSIFNGLDQNGQSRLTWQPQQGLRFATVTIQYNGGYVVAGASLLEPEKLIDDLGRLILFAWIGGVAFAELALWIITSAMKKKNAKQQA